MKGTASLHVCCTVRIKQASPAQHYDLYTHTMTVYLHGAATGDPSSDVSLLGVIGRGGFGSVYKAMWHDMLVRVLACAEKSMFYLSLLFASCGCFGSPSSSEWCLPARVTAGGRESAGAR